LMEDVCEQPTPSIPQALPPSSSSEQPMVAKSHRSASARPAPKNREWHGERPQVPMPTRTVPHIYQFAHEVSPEHDHDWTEATSYEETCRLRAERNGLIKDMLKSGKNAAYRSSGNSLLPRVRSNDICEYEPVTRDDQVSKTDIVFCQIRERYWAHLVLRKEWRAYSTGGFYAYAISNMKGRENGWTTINKIYGRLVGSWQCRPDELAHASEQSILPLPQPMSAAPAAMAAIQRDLSITLVKHGQASERHRDTRGHHGHQCTAPTTVTRGISGYFGRG
jgi:hypothetical protein